MESIELKISEVASVLNISEATIRNWVKHKYLTPIKKEGQVFFEKVEVDNLKKNIVEGKIIRLNNRANKAGSNKTFIPDEYHNSDLTDKIEKIISFVMNKKINKEKALFLLSICQLKKEGLLNFKDNISTIKIEELFCKHNGVNKVLSEWSEDLKISLLTNDERELLKQDIPLIKDFLGVIYQSLLQEGEKATLGSYYTPSEIIEYIGKEYASEGMRILDPCCGTGQFLITLSNRIKDPFKIYGYDIDDIAVKICRINMLIKFKDRKFYPQIYNLNTLLEKIDKQKFNLIATNPPWGYHFKKEEIKEINKRYPEIVSEESFSFFLKKSIELLDNDGIVSFILPESILNVAIHKDIRKYILDNMKIIRIDCLNRVFKNVFTKVIRIDLKKDKPSSNLVKITTSKGEHEIVQQRFMDNKDYVFNILSNDLDEKIISKVYLHNYVTLKDNAEWALGIVTGDNGKYISSQKLQGFEPIITGKEVSPFNLLPPTSYIKFEPNNFQQVAPEHKYRTNEKLIYKFISNKLVFSYDNKQILTLNSANILIPKITSYPIKTILALFNSPIYQFIHKKKFNSIKILRSHIEELPLPLFSEDINKKIESMVDKILYKQENANDLNEYLSELFNLSKDEKEYLKKN